MNITLDTLKALVPKRQRSMVTEHLVDILNNAANDPKIIEEFKDNFVSYLNVLSTGKYSMKDYINAVKFVSYKLLEYSDLQAYIATFPDRYKRLLEDGVKEVAPYASMYKKTKLVTQIYEQTVIPSHILNAPLHQKALNILATIMTDLDEKGLVRVKAAEAILVATKQPENAKVKVDIAIQDIDAISDLTEATKRLAQIQLEALQNGSTNIKNIAESSIIDVEAINEPTIEDSDDEVDKLSNDTKYDTAIDYYATDNGFSL